MHKKIKNKRFSFFNIFLFRKEPSFAAADLQIERSFPVKELPPGTPSAFRRHLAVRTGLHPFLRASHMS